MEFASSVKFNFAIKTLKKYTAHIQLPLLVTQYYNQTFLVFLV